MAEPILGSAYNFYAGSNIYGCPSSLTNDECIATLGSRLRGLWVRDLVSGRFVVYVPGLDGSEQALSLVTPFAGLGTSRAMFGHRLACSSSSTSKA